MTVDSLPRPGNIRHGSGVSVLERDMAASVAAWAGEFWGSGWLLGDATVRTSRGGVPKTDHNLRATVGTACLYPASTSNATMLRLALPNATPIR